MYAGNPGQRTRIGTGIAAIILGATLAASAVLFSARVDAAPQLPHVFFGIVTIGGNAAIGDLPIQARIDNVNYAQSVEGGTVSRGTFTNDDGTYGTSTNFQVCADIPDTLSIEGGITSDVIEFYVRVNEQWFLAESSESTQLIDPVLFAAGGSSRVDLSVPDLTNPSGQPSPSPSACSTNVEPMDGTCGDQNEDNLVDVKDAIIDLRLSSNPDDATEEQEILSDLDHDGNLTVKDAAKILDHIVGIEPITDCGPVAE